MLLRASKTLSLARVARDPILLPVGWRLRPPRVQFWGAACYLACRSGGNLPRNASDPEAEAASVRIRTFIFSATPHAEAQNLPGQPIPKH